MLKDQVKVELELRDVLVKWLKWMEAKSGEPASFIVERILSSEYKMYQSAYHDLTEHYNIENPFPLPWAEIDVNDKEDLTLERGKFQKLKEV